MCKVRKLRVRSILVDESFTTLASKVRNLRSGFDEPYDSSEKTAKYQIVIKTISVK